MDEGIGGWVDSAQAWIEGQGESGDTSRQIILDPCLRVVLGDLTGLSVLDVGCGEGRYCRVMAGRGAAVTGVDPVPAFVERARTLHPSGTYVEAFGESLPFEDDSFDVVLSYLSLVDIPDFRAGLREMARVMNPRGRLVIATISNVSSTSDGWIKDEAGSRLHKPVDRYMEDFAMELEWSGLKILNYHRPLSAVLSALFEAGLVMDGFHEPLPPESSEWYANEFRVPTFQVMTFRVG